MKYPSLLAATLAISPLTTALSFAHTPPLIVVEDKGGTSAMPYYRALKLQQRAKQTPSLSLEIPRTPTKPFSEADMLPVRSAKLSPGVVVHRTIEAPGLMPFFLIGDDDISRTWLRDREATLRKLNAVGLVVNVTSLEALVALRQVVPSLSLAPVSGDDLAERLGLRHYPVLITATGIEQ